VRRNIAFATIAGTLDHQGIARFPSTTLVLDSHSPDFSTDAVNSDLIESNEISAQPKGLQEEKEKREEKQRSEIS
jgi:hypothetical protein